MVPQTLPNVYPGLPFTLSVLKKDAYNQTILSDSNSFLQAFTSHNQALSADPFVSILGNGLAKMESGIALYSIAVKPTFASVNIETASTALETQPYIYLAGLDAQTGIMIQSAVIKVLVEQGEQVCPRGYILAFDKDTSENGTAVCTLCKPGSYSINPLARLPGTGALGPSCVNCPAGGNCEKGGGDVAFAVGNWTPVRGMYVLTGCPGGYQLINSTSGSSKGIFSNNLQQCRGCRLDQYIIDPNSDDCQACPAGNSPPETCLVFICSWFNCKTRTYCLRLALISSESVQVPCVWTVQV